MDEKYLDGFREIYTEYSDDDIRSLLAQGETFFDEDSFSLLCEEARKRAIRIP